MCSPRRRPVELRTVKRKSTRCTPRLANLRWRRIFCRKPSVDEPRPEGGDDRSGSFAAQHRASVRPGEHRALFALLHGHGRERPEFGIDAPDRRAVFVDSLVRSATAGPSPEAARLLGGSQKDPSPDAADGFDGHLPEAEYVAAASGASDLSVLAPGCAGRSAEPCVVCRYQLCPDATRLPVSGGDHGLGDPHGALLALVEYVGQRFLHGGAGGGPGRVRHTRDLQHRSRVPIH